MPDKI